MNRGPFVFFILGASLAMSGCVTRSPENDRSYVSISNQPYEREGCDPVVSPVERRRLLPMTRDRLPNRIAAAPFRTYSYGTQTPLDARPEPGRALCFVVIREKHSWHGPVESILGLEMEAAGDQAVRLTITRINLDSSALWKTGPSEVNLAILFALADDDGAPPRLVSQGAIDLGPTLMGQDWRRPWQPPVPIEKQSTILSWPSDLTNVRLIAVVGERRWGRARPSAAVMALQVRTIAADSIEWAPAR
ncbi:MAG: hypothetical protein Q7J26_03820 [Brevundimonas sp.]|nr:hypothetical protein [Brevundimonas sp.]